MADHIADVGKMVPTEWTIAALAVQPPWHMRDIRAVIAAVAPLIRAAERERCAKVAEDYHNTSIHGAWSSIQVEIAYAIRGDSNG